METKAVIERIKTLFFDSLSLKNGWGKKEVKELYNECVYTALVEAIGDHEKSDNR